MSESKPPILQTSTAPSASDQGDVGARRNWKRLWLVIDCVIAAFLLLLGYGGYEFGIFTNVIAVLLMVLVPVNLMRLMWRIWRREVYFDIFKRPFAVESRKYWWPCAARLLFYLCCAYLFSIAVGPLQFSRSEFNQLRIMNWGLIGLQLILACFPAKRISVPITTVFTVGSVFMIWQFVQVTIPYRGEVIALNSPMKGVCLVGQGGRSGIVNHHYPLQSQRCAIDLFKVAETPDQVKRWEILPPDQNLGQVVISPRDGRVAFCEDGHPDNVKGHTDREHLAGNYITVEIGPGKYLMLAHLMEHSIQVKPGDSVKSGQPLAKCGNSGNTTQPHVHMQIQSAPEFSVDVNTFPFTIRSVLRNDVQLHDVQVRRNDLLLLNSVP
jgi:hypothetical protein